MQDRSEISDTEIFERFPDVLIDQDNIDHYRGLLVGQLLFRQCQECHYWIYPHRPICPQCWSSALEYRPVTGNGKVFMSTIIYQPREPGQINYEPVPVAAVELEEQPGLRYLAQIVHCSPEEIHPEMPVTLVWRQSGGNPCPAFEPKKG